MRRRRHRRAVPDSCASLQQQSRRADFCALLCTICKLVVRITPRRPKRRSVENRLSPRSRESRGKIRSLLNIVSVRRNGFGDKHDPVLTDSLVSTDCDARSTNFAGYYFCSVGFSRRDRASHCFAHITGCASSRSDGASRSLIREWRAKIGSASSCLPERRAVARNARSVGTS
jgi:hypothetical protein